MKKILVIGAGEMQVPVINKVNQLGFLSIVVDINPFAPGFKYALKKEIISTDDYNGILRIANKYSIDGVVTTSDYPVNIVAKLSKELSLSSMSEEVANICTNKFLQRKVLKEAGLNVPFFQQGNNIDDINGLYNFPLVIKPVDSSASRGVKKVNSKNELIDQFDEALSFSKSKSVLVEEFLEGREFSVETLTQNYITEIIAITEKLLVGTEYGFFVEDTHIEPARISSSERILIEDAVLKAIRVVGLNNCPSHTEVIINNNGAYIVEIACRLGGDYITSDLVPLTTGVDMLANLIRLSLGEDLIIERNVEKFSLVQFLNSTNYDRCISFIQSNNINIVRSEINKFHTRVIQSSLDRLGYIILCCNTREDLEFYMQKIK